jgi:hypothetical protein
MRANLFQYFVSASVYFKVWTTVVLKITDDISVDLERQFFIRLVIFDISKTSDTVGHDPLYQKLLSYSLNFSDSAVRFVRLYLTCRTQSVFCNGTVTQGVPEESVLGPLLFSLFIIDIISSIFFSRYHTDDLQIYLIEQWLLQNRLL